ncbi:MAG: hypothetical protein MJ211_07900 [Bacteroidales bacterium]|nr:hypothetical protein [Bacteroidales bacterium]
MDHDKKIFTICPKCGKRIEIVDDTNIQVRKWSDGSKILQLNFAHENTIIKCNCCEHIYWLEDSEVFEDDNINADDLNNQNILFNNFTEIVKFMNSRVNFYQSLIDNGYGNTYERDIYLNIKLIWAVNDFRRQFSGDYKNNDISILHGNLPISKFRGVFLLENEYENHRYLKYLAIKRVLSRIDNQGYIFEIEANREIHNFRTVSKLLDKFNLDNQPKNLDPLQYGTKCMIYSDDNLQYLLKKLKNKSFWRSSRIFEY